MSDYPRGKVDDQLLEDSTPRTGDLWQRRRPLINILHIETLKVPSVFFCLLCFVVVVSWNVQVDETPAMFPITVVGTLNCRRRCCAEARRRLQRKPQSS